MDPDTEFIGPIQMGLNKPIHFTDFESSVRDIVDWYKLFVILITAFSFAFLFLLVYDSINHGYGGGYKLLQAMDPDTEFIGPIQMGLNKPIHFTDFESKKDIYLFFLIDL